MRYRILHPEFAHADQQHHFHAALGGGGQRAAELAARREIWIGQQHALARPSQRLQVGALDGAAVAQVVAHHKAGLHHVLRFDLADLAQVAEQLEALEQAQLAQPLPLRHRLVLDRRHQRSAHRHRKVPARRGQADAVVVVAIHVIVDVDATDKGHVTVDHANLAVGAGHAALEPGIEDAVLDAGREQLGVHALDPRVAGAEPVGDHAHLHAARCSRDQHAQHALPGVVAGEDIGLEIDFVLGRFDGLYQRGEIVGAAVQQADFVIGQEVH